jgi:hypothetical protein
VQSNIVVTNPAPTVDLMTLDEFKIALNITGTAQDPLLQSILDRVSDEVARLCNNRIFGKEGVVETFTEIPIDCHRLFLARYPVHAIDINSFDNNGAALTLANGDFMLDSEWGKITLNSGTFIDQTQINYTGGWNIPVETPPALKQAVVMIGRETYYATLRGDATVRMIGHKESRIIYFDPNILARSMAGGATVGGTPAMRAAHDLLVHFTRYEA